MHEMNVLITAASRRVPLILSFVQALKRLGIRGNVVTTDMDRLSPGLYFSDRHYIVPLTTDPRYISIIRSVCFKERVRLLIPTIDDELPIFGSHAESFLATGVRVAISSHDTCTICNDKYLTAQFLSEHAIPCARTWTPEQLDIPNLTYPLFLKPRSGRGSVGAHPVDNERQLRYFLDEVPDPVVQEYLPGREFTIDLLADFNSKVISAVPRERLVIRSGVTDRGQTLNHPGMIQLAVRVAEALQIRGPANVQVKLKDDQPTVFEINPRFSGGIPLTIASGADFPAWLIELRCGRRVRPCLGKFTDGLMMSCYESAIFLPDEAANAMRPLAAQL
ncbi:MAG TPA: ATP-grasp domain-containing protein [Acidobacteriota bacterium]|nr:ATP-grasp domain-containing protein [Acidobacteriota bacterium]